MPEYSYTDENGHKWNVFKWFSQIYRQERCPECGEVGHRIMAPHAIGIPRAERTDTPYVGKRHPR